MQHIFDLLSNFIQMIKHAAISGVGELNVFHEIHHVIQMAWFNYICSYKHTKLNILPKICNKEKGRCQNKLSYCPPGTFIEGSWVHKHTLSSKVFFFFYFFLYILRKQTNNQKFVLLNVGANSVFITVIHFGIVLFEYWEKNTSGSMQASVIFHSTKRVIHVGRGWNHSNTIQKRIFMCLLFYQTFGQIAKFISQLDMLIS